MKNGWYILNYHDISWEENDLMRGIGGSFPPDIFRDHLDNFNRYGKIVSVQEGFAQYQKGTIKAPLISIWFDDGFAGVRKYAFPILETYNVKAAISINSRFTLNEEMFWRCKLSFINQVDGMRFLRSKLRKYGYKTNMLIKVFVLDHFCDEIVEAIDRVYNLFTREYFRRDAFRIFDNFDGIKELQNNGWEIANHSASHYPVGESSYIHKFKDEFMECEKAINSYLGIKTRFWVVPFDRKRDIKLKDVFSQINHENSNLVLVGDIINNNYNKDERIIYRIIPEFISGKEMIKKLRRLHIHQ